MALSKFDLGGCNCGPACHPCALSAVDLTNTWSIICPGGTLNSGANTLHYLGGRSWLSDCMDWTGNVPPAATQSARLAIDCGIADASNLFKIGTRYKLFVWTVAACSGAPLSDLILKYEFWFYDLGGTLGYGMGLAAFACAPLNIVLRGPCTSTFDITP